MGKYGTRCNCYTRSDAPRHNSASGRCHRTLEGDRMYCDECLRECGAKEPTFYREYPRIEMPRYLLTEGWKDTSWHNDAAASSAFTGPNGRTVIVWVDYPNPKDREMGDAPGWKQFNLFVSETDDPNDMIDGTARSTDSEFEMETMARALIEEHLGGTHLERTLKG